MNFLFPSPALELLFARDRIANVAEDGPAADLPDQQFCPAGADHSVLYRRRWQIELFFKWIKQHLRIKAFYGTSENAVKTQIWIAMCSYLLVAIVRKRLHLPVSLYTMLQILSVSLFEKTPINQAFLPNNLLPQGGENPNQLCLLDF